MAMRGQLFRYGEIGVEVIPVGELLVGEGPEGTDIQNFKVVVSMLGEDPYTMRFSLDYKKSEKPIFLKKAAWYAMGEFTSALHVPGNMFEEINEMPVSEREKIKYRRELERLIYAARRFGYKAVDDAAEQAGISTVHFLKALEEPGPLEWFPGVP